MRTLAVIIATILPFTSACTAESTSDTAELGQLDPSGKDDSLGTFEVSVPPRDVRRLQFGSAAFGYLVDVTADGPFTLDLWNVDLPAAKQFFTRTPATEANIEAIPGNMALPGESYNYLLSLTNESDAPLTASVELSTLVYDPCLHDEHLYTDIADEQKLARCSEVLSNGDTDEPVTAGKFCVVTGALTKPASGLDAGERYVGIDGYVEVDADGFSRPRRLETASFFAFSEADGSTARETEDVIESESEATSIDGKTYFHYDKDAQTLTVVHSVKDKGLFGLSDGWDPVLDVTFGCESVAEGT